MTGLGDRARVGAGVDVSLESLETFKKGVDGLLEDLEDSPAAPTSMGRDTLKSACLGTGFGEAESLMSAYRHVRDQLSTLSRTLSDQIESMSLLAHVARNDYRNVDEEQSARLWAIWHAANRHYRETADHETADHGTGAGTTAGTGAGTEAGTGAGTGTGTGTGDGRPDTQDPGSGHGSTSGGTW